MTDLNNSGRWFEVQSSVGYNTWVEAQIYKWTVEFYHLWGADAATSYAWQSKVITVCQEHEIDPGYVLSKVGLGAAKMFSKDNK